MKAIGNVRQKARRVCRVTITIFSLPLWLRAMHFLICSCLLLFCSSCEIPSVYSEIYKNNGICQRAQRESLNRERFADTSREHQYVSDTQDGG